MKTKQEMKERVTQLVKAQLHESASKVGYAPTLGEAVNEAFAGLDLVLLESSAHGNEFKKKTKGQYLFMERGDETYIIAKINGEIDGIHSVDGKGERVRLRNDSELRSFIADRVMEGFIIGRSTREAKGVLSRTIRGIVSVIRRHGLKFSIIGGLIALIIAFVGSHMIPLMASIAARLNIGGAEVVTVGDARGMFGVDIEPIPEEIPDVELDALLSIDQQPSTM